MPRRVLLLIALSALVAAGCGSSSDSSSDFEGEQQRVAQVVEDLQEASVEDEPRRVCQSLLAPQAVARIGRGKCVAAVDAALKDADTYELDVKDVRISGTTARARVESGRDGDQVETIELVKVGRDWKIARFGEPAQTD